MRRLAAFTVLLALFSLALAASGWTVQDCVEVDWDHPDCDQYPTTTTTYGDNDPCDEYHETRHPECQTTTTGQATTTTSEGTTTTTPNETTTTQFTQQTTTTVQECVPPLVHQAPFCVDPTTTAPPTETVPAPTTPAGEESLPFTGLSAGDLALIGLSLSAAGLLLLLVAGSVRKTRA